MQSQGGKISNIEWWPWSIRGLHRENAPQIDKINDTQMDNDEHYSGSMVTHSWNPDNTEEITFS